MPTSPFRRPNKAVNAMTTAALVLDQTSGSMRQLVLELKHEKNVKGALDIIAREADLPFSKVRRIYYRLTDQILAYERDRLKAAISRLSEQQEARIEKRLEQIRALRDERRLLQQHGELGV